MKLYIFKFYLNNCSLYLSFVTLELYFRKILHFFAKINEAKFSENEC